MNLSRDDRRTVCRVACLVYLCCLLLALISCLPGDPLAPPSGYTPPEEVPVGPDEPGSSGGSGLSAAPAELPATPVSGGSAGNASADAGSGDEMRPVGFTNYGTINATVRAWTFVPLGSAEAAPPPSASTVSTVRTDPGLWPNPSRFITFPVGTYTWCVEWEDGDIDDDGNIDYFHYIESEPTVLDFEDSTELDLAQDVAVSTPPEGTPIVDGPCGASQTAGSCEDQLQHVRVYDNPGWLLGTPDAPPVRAYGNPDEIPTPDGITLVNGGGLPFQAAVILFEAGQFMEVTTSDPYTAIGVQPHGEGIIGWARVLFDGREVRRGDTSAYWHDDQKYLHAVYIEVRCFAPGTHTLRIENLGLPGSGGGITVPITYFGFRP